MLDAFIIDEIKKRQREEDARKRIQPVIPLPNHFPERPLNNENVPEDEENPQRGVIIIDYGATIYGQRDFYKSSFS